MAAAAAAAIRSPTRAASSAAGPAAPTHPRAVLRVASSARPRRGAVAAAAMQPAKAVAAEAASPAAAAVEMGNGAAVVAGLQRPDAMGRFGKFGGKYVPETLMHALTELENAFHALATDDEFQVTLPPPLLCIGLLLVYFY